LLGEGVKREWPKKISQSNQLRDPMWHRRGIYVKLIMVLIKIPVQEIGPNYLFGPCETIEKKCQSYYYTWKICILFYFFKKIAFLVMHLKGIYGTIIATIYILNKV
jgi:hypothetical protein